MPYKTKGRRRQYKRRRLYKKGAKRSKGFKKAVQRIINKNAENKESFTNISNVTFNSGINSAADIQWVVPDMTQGSADNQRIGHQIRARYLTVRGYVASNLTYTTSNQCRLGIRIMIVQPKPYPSADSVYDNATTWQAGLLKKGGTTTNFTGVTSDLMAPINRDLITVYYDKVIYINTPYMITSEGSANTYNTVRFFSKKFKLRNKLLRYDVNNNSGLSPVNWNPVLICGYCHLDGSSPDTISQQIQVSYDSILNFQDI